MNSIVTITTSAESQDLTTLATVKDELRIKDGSQDAKLARWITQSSIAIASYCNRSFGLETVTESFRPDLSFKTLTLARFPVTNIASVVEDDVALTVVQYEADLANGRLTKLSSGVPTTWSTGKVVVAYSAGYDLLGTLPYDVERACLSLVRMLHFSIPRDPLAKHIEIPGVRVVDYWIGNIGTNGLPPDVVELLEPYRCIPI